MEEKCILENLLTLTKSLAMLYINGTIESSNKEVRKVMLDGLNCSLELQEELYNILVDEGYYKVENVGKTEIEKLKKKVNQD